MSERITLVVHRESTDECTFAVVSCDKTDKITTPRHVPQAVITAVTAWVQNTTEGREAYNRTAADFNIGDLSQESLLPPSALGLYLEEQGVVNLAIETHVHDYGSVGWTYDQHLVNDAAIDAD